MHLKQQDNTLGRMTKPTGLLREILGKTCKQSLIKSEDLSSYLGIIKKADEK